MYSLVSDGRNMERNLRPRRHLILTEDEWSRISKHLVTVERLKKEEGANINCSGKITQSLPVGRPHWTINHYGNGKQKWKKTESVSEEVPMRGAWTRDKTKKEIIMRANQLLFENKDYARRLLHGLRLSSVYHERDNQMEFARSLRQLLEVVERENQMKLWEEWKRYEKELIMAKMKKKEMHESLRKELDIQIKQKIEGREREKEEKEREGKNIVKMTDELRAMLEREKKDEKNKKEKLKNDIENYLKSKREIRDRLKMEEEEQEQIDKIYQTVAWELDKRRKDKEKALFDKSVKIDNDIYKDVKGKVKMRSCESDKKLKSFLLMREARKKTLLNDLLTSKKEAEEEADRRRHAELLERRRSVIERYRKAEGDRLWNLREKEERRKIMNNTGRYYIMQWREKKDLEKEEKALDKFYGPDFTMEGKILEYCDEVFELVKRHSRPLFPVAAAIKDVKKEFGLKPVKNLNFLKSNVPIGK